MAPFPDRLSRIAAFGVVALGVFAGTANGRSVTLAQSEQIALERHPRLASALENVAAAEAGVVRSRATLLPSASVSGTYTRNMELPVLITSFGTFVSGDTNAYQAALSVSQPLFLGFAGVTGLDLARVGESSARVALEQTTQEVLSGVREAYFGAVLARKIVQVQEEAVAQAESSLAQVQLRFNVGTASGFDLLRARVQLATTRPNLVTARSNRQIADAGLRLAMGLGPSEVVEPADTLAPFTSRWADAPLDTLLRVAYADRPDVRQLAYQEQAAEDQVGLAKSAYYPYLFAFGRAQWQAQTHRLSASPDFLRSTGVGLQLSWTVWDSWKTPASVQLARVGLRQVAQAAKLLRDGVSVDVESAQLRLQEASVNVRSGEETVEQAEEALRLARVLYAEGGSTQLDVINAQVALTQAQTQYAQALYQYHVAHVRLEKALGVIERAP